MKLSVIIITFNEEQMIGDCIKSISKLADEILVIDSESVDKTVEIAQKLGARILVNKFKDFASQRNFGLEKATGKWILYVDADERVTPQLVDSIKYLVFSNRNTDYAAFRIQRKNFYFGNHEWLRIEKLERLFKKDKLKGWYGELHESPKVDGEIGELDGFLLHYSHKDLTSMLQKTIEWSKIEAELRFRAGHPKMNWWRFLRVMATAFADSYFKQSGWKVGTAGIIESLYQSFSMFVTYARLWELQSNETIKQ